METVKKKKKGKKKKKKKIDQEFEKTFNHRYGRCLIHWCRNARRYISK